MFLQFSIKINVIIIEVLSFSPVLYKNKRCDNHWNCLTDAIPMIYTTHFFNEIRKSFHNKSDCLSISIISVFH